MSASLYHVHARGAAREAEPPLSRACPGVLIPFISGRIIDPVCYVIVEIPDVDPLCDVFREGLDGNDAVRHVSFFGVYANTVEAMKPLDNRL